ncbi:MAG: hypothetical protein Q9227_005618 [Pyrenula ochraceoflavens]
MSSTDQPADPYKATNKDEPGTEEKIKALGDFIAGSKFGMMTTRIASSGLLVSRCMAVAGQENGGIDLIFHTNTETGKTDDLASDPHVNMSFLNSTGEWGSISGQSEIITERDTVKKYYSPALKAWIGDLGDGVHDGGPDDPRIGVIKVKMVTATYAINRGNIVSRGVEIVSGAVKGDAPKVNKLREISESEVKDWRSKQ